MQFTRRFDRLSQYLNDSRWPNHALDEVSSQKLDGMRKDLIDIFQDSGEELETACSRLITFFDQLGADTATSEGIADMEINAARAITQPTRQRL